MVNSTIQYQKLVLEAIFSDFPIAVAVLDGEMKYVYASEFWYKLHQLEGQAIIGKNHAVILPEILECKAWLTAYEHAQNGELAECTHEGITKYSGINQSIHWTLKPWRDAGTQIQLGVMMYAETVSGQREMKSKELEQFVYVASHDLQEPLRTVISVVSLLRGNYKHQLDESANKCLDFLAQASDRMSKLIKGLLDYARLGKDRQMTQVDCVAVVNTVQEDMSAIIVESQTTIVVGELPTIKGFEIELRLLFQNLLTNAIRFRKTEEPPKIKLDAKQVGKRWVFSFKDNGIGIDLNHREKIFTMFQRLHIRNKYEGNGIGLAHCRKIIELHGGEIWVDSELDKGSIFYFTIPINKQ